MRVLLTRHAGRCRGFCRPLVRSGVTALLIAPLLSCIFPDGPPLRSMVWKALLARAPTACARWRERTGDRYSALRRRTTDGGRQPSGGFTQVESADGDVAALAQAMPRWAGPGVCCCMRQAQKAKAALHPCSQPRVTLCIRHSLRCRSVNQLPDNVVQALTDCSLDAAFFFFAAQRARLHRMYCQGRIGGVHVQT